MSFTDQENKDFYTAHHDAILSKRFDSPFPIRKYVHRAQYEALLSHVRPGETVLDAGCGEGVIGFLLAERGIASTGMDISAPNIAQAKQGSERRGFRHLTTFIQGDAEHLPFADQSFDVVISSHVLEHVPHLDQGWKELCRVARKRVIVAMPTCQNLCAFALLGGDHGYWSFSKRSLFAIPWGIMRWFGNLRGVGIQEGYAGQNELPHIWRYPREMRAVLKHPEWKLMRFEASTLCLPYFNYLLPVVRWLDRYRHLRLFRNFGYGSTAVFEKMPESIKK